MEEAHGSLDDTPNNTAHNTPDSTLGDQPADGPPERIRDEVEVPPLETQRDTVPAGDTPPATTGEADESGETGVTGEPLARVRYGLAKELRLYPDSLVVEYLEEHEETRITLDNIKRLILTPGEYNPSKLVLMVDLDDGNTVIVAEGMSNVRGFRALLAKLQEIRPAIELDPADMDTQLQQALEIRRRGLLGCYGGLAGLCLAFWIIYLVVAYIGMHGPR
jgi:hypothetical protein